jgi:biotin carboxylase
MSNDLKKILLLGGSFSQVPAILEAKSRGLYVILCDYLKQSPGHKLADESYLISITDVTSILSLAIECKPNFIISFASDPGAKIASLVSEKLGLPTNPFKSVRILSEKNLFRSFQKNNNFNVPRFHAFSVIEADYSFIENFTFPVIVKPTDSSGSKGVSVIENKYIFPKVIPKSKLFSKNQILIVEEFIKSEFNQIHGDGFVLNGKLKYFFPGDQKFNSTINGLVPIQTTWPSLVPKPILKKIHQEISKIIKKSGFKNGPINFEVRISIENQIYVIEIGPRNGGNFVPQAIKYSTGFDSLSALFNLLEGIEITSNGKNPQPTAYYVLHSNIHGILKSIEIDPNINQYICEIHQYISYGEKVNVFENASDAIGVILVKFNSIREMKFYMDNFFRFVKIILE